MRPIAYGLIVFFGSGVLWFLFSVVAGFETASNTLPTLIFNANGTTTQIANPAANNFVAWSIPVYIFGLLFFFSIPAAIMAEIVRWRKQKKK